MARKTPQLMDRTYHVYDPTADRVTTQFDIEQCPQDWQEQVTQLKSLRVTITNKQGFQRSFSCYRDKRDTSKNPLGFWVARKIINKRQRNLYIGADENMTRSKLAQIADKLGARIK